jgi:hypothetical protein
VATLLQCSSPVERRFASTRSTLSRASVNRTGQRFVLQHFNVFRLPAFGAFYNGEFYRLAFRQAAISAGLNCGFISHQVQGRQLDASMMFPLLNMAPDQLVQ